ncbi:TAT-variant-translocated molybdopterin oxidoreductase [Aequorivita lipolytica]|uniref:4Fe-4S dicluster domain-containing protein n=1 Tax=Aequorivita lipolytica TaxID=153267 RepID=A0A5C6YUC7_9FLAO|nr:TAT-variant-translocated molybdopterin oxidoreductase [Aequorivita lipolytica]TXD70637.1 4Fe-4S dicluster domain-containing protein [Aequorivita lipolytica]SRX49671.1 Menaquinone reductase, iron-sulfur cluster-binding subunit [Aequorivita lipolytica]
MASNKKYWKSVEQLNEDSAIVKALQDNEFVNEIPTDDFLGNKEALESSSTTRRDFLKYMGFSTAAATLAACEGPVVKSIPYVVQPNEIVPGVANYYASTMADGFDFANILVKTREGRPIKVERNDLAVNAGGSANARVHASILSLYDKNRMSGPMVDGAVVSWPEFDTAVAQQMNEMAGKDVVLLTQTFASPSTSKLIAEFTAKYPNVRHVVYDTVSYSAALDAFQTKYGTRALPDYDFSKADVIVSVGADFLGDWQGGSYSKGYAQGRIPKNGKISRHVQFEANLTLSGGKADKRVLATPSQQMQIVKALTGGSASGLPANLADAVNKAKAQLQKAGSKALLVTGLPDVESQTAALNFNANSEAMDSNKPLLIRQSSNSEVMNVVNGVVSGSIKGMITVGVDPVYSFPNSKEFTEGYKKLDMTLAFAMKQDATASLAKLVAATPHYLESWGDMQLKKGTYSLAQPTIRPMFNTRQFQDCLLKWTGNSKNYYDYIKESWTASILQGSSWNKTLEAGILISDVEVNMEEGMPAKGITLMEDSTSNGAVSSPSLEGDFELTLYTSTGLGDGQQANNPWLQEFPDPITRASWDNYLTISAADAEALELENFHVSNGALNGSYVNVKLGTVVIENVPVIVQPGQAKGSVGLALGYGKTAAIQEEMQTGVNAYPLYQNFSEIQKVNLEKASGMHEFACVQLQNTMAGRSDDIIKDTTLEIFNTKNISHWNAVPVVDYDHAPIEVRDKKADIWTPFDDTIGHHFNLSIDLNACTGCGACVIACHAENNVPVVGKEEVRKFRDMHWLRIDRYYSAGETFQEEIDTLENLPAFDFYDVVEEPAYLNPQVAFQPVMCQHCNHAPCETVCPVAATSHGRQGQNQMAYNRCVGTRYCANNCPYKVRRFNWFLYNENDEFDYNMNNDLGRMVLNPDVVVRSRGVMEKCSMCIQITQKTILDAKRDGRPVKDGEFHTACSRACQTEALVFGDVNDKESEILKMKDNDRMYHLLENVGTRPNVFYQMIVRNTSEA